MADYSYRTLLIEKDAGVATVTLNRPDRLNAVGDGMHEELEDLFGRMNEDVDIKAVLLTGAGRAFCAGGDISSMDQRPDAAASGIPSTFSRGPRRLIMNILEVEVPIVVAINGDAVGFGATIALFGDIIYAAEGARIGDAHTRVGLVAGDGGAVIWPLMVGVHRAKEYLMTGDLITATEAERIGLINHVVPPDDLLPQARKMAERMANGATWALRWTKASINKLIRERMNLILDASLAYEALTVGTEDHKEAVRAFTEKRRPEYTGR